MRLRAWLLLLLAAGLFLASAPAPPPEEAPLDELFESFFDRFLELHPTFASSLGDPRFNDRLTLDLLPSHRQQRAALFASTRAALAAVDRDELDATRRLHLDALDYAIGLYLEGLEFDDHLLPIAPGITLQASFAQMGSGHGDHPFRSARDYDDFLSRIDDFSTWVDAAIANMRQGIETGMVEPRSLIEATLSELRAQFSGRVKDSVFYLPVAAMPKDVAPADRKRLAAAFEKAIVERLRPAYRRLHDFLAAEYLPSARDTLSLADLPGGRRAYRHLVRFFTTTEMTPEEVFELGLAEVERVRKEMEQLKRRSGFEGSLAAFRRQLAADPRSFLSRPQDVFDGFAAIRERITPALARLFNLRPRATFDIRPVEPHRAANSPGAFYEGPSADGSRPGTFYVNVRGRFYPKYTMETLFLHEALPGHHFQIALARERDGLPRFLRYGYFGAYVEGWGLYSEGLGHELGLYTDPLQYYGRLVYDLGRAGRLVADVGIHYKGWTRGEAERFLGERGLDWAIGEIDRYAAMPGQALAYKVGERELWRLRHRAESVLGQRFDVRRFHDEVLKDGALPLAVLAAKIDRWIAAERLRPSM